jgi:hypothetical protein
VSWGAKEPSVHDSVSSPVSHSPKSLKLLSSDFRFGVFASLLECVVTSNNLAAIASSVKIALFALGVRQCRQ